MNEEFSVTVTDEHVNKCIQYVKSNLEDARSTHCCPVAQAVRDAIEESLKDTISMGFDKLSVGRVNEGGLKIYDCLEASDITRLVTNAGPLVLQNIERVRKLLPKTLTFKLIPKNGTWLYPPQNS